MDPINLLTQAAETYFQGSKTETDLRTKARSVANHTIKGTRQLFTQLAITVLAVVVSAIGVWFLASSLTSQLNQGAPLQWSASVGVCLAVLGAGAAGLWFGLSGKQWDKIVQRDIEAERDAEQSERARAEAERLCAVTEQDAKNKALLQSVILGLAQEFLESRKEKRAGTRATHRPTSRKKPAAPEANG